MSALPAIHPDSTSAVSTETHHGIARASSMILRWAIPIVVVGVSAFATLRYRAAHAAAPVHYETGSVDRGAIAAKVTATGALSALVTVSVGSQVSGRIDSLRVDFGSMVKKGQEVATIEASLFRAAVAQAKANYLVSQAGVEKAKAGLIEAQRQFVRAKRLLDESLMSRSDYEVAEAQAAAAEADVSSSRAGVAQAKAALDQAELNLHYTTIVSPIDGVVISRSVDVGQTVAASFQAPTLFTIAQDLTRMQVDTNVAEGDVGKLREGMPVTFTVDAHPQRSFDGVVRQVRDNAQTLQNVVTYDAVIDVDNHERLLRPGMTASVTFVYATRDDALRIPNAALRFKPDVAALAVMAPRAGAASNALVHKDLRPDERRVWIRRSDEATPAVVRIGISDGTVSEVLRGDLQSGDAIVEEATVASGEKHGS